MHRNRAESSEESRAKTQATDVGRSAGASGEAAAPPRAELDFEALDLSIETVEERISPSETNVFDK